MLNAYHLLLRLYPATYRAEFGAEMIAVFEGVRADCDRKSFAARAVFYFCEIAGLVSGAFRENFHFRSNAPDVPFFPRRFTMRNEFRFPKSTPILMAIILAGVIIAIRKGEVIATSLPPFSQPVTPVHSAHSYLLPGVIEGFIFFPLAGLVGWVILFAMRRSGVHRLTDVSSGSK